MPLELVSASTIRMPKIKIRTKPYTMVKSRQKSMQIIPLEDIFKETERTAREQKKAQKIVVKKEKKLASRGDSTD